VPLSSEENDPAVLISDYVTLAKALLELAEESDASTEALQRILNKKTKGVSL